MVKGENTVSVNCIRSVEYIPINPNNQYSISSNLNYSYVIWFYDKNFMPIATSSNLRNIPSNAFYMRFRTSEGKVQNDLNVKIQIEEGTVTTQYEPYKEYKTSILLGSPPLKGDEIVWKEDGIYHYHKVAKNVFDGSNDEKWSLTTPPAPYCKYVTSGPILNNAKNIGKFITNYGLIMTNPYADSNLGLFIYNNCIRVRLKDNVDEELISFKDTLSNNPLTLIYELAEPYYEKISDDKFISEIPNNATLHIDSAIPCQSVKASYTGKLPSVYGLEKTNKNQDELINVSLCATDEMYMMLEPLLQSVPQTLQINERMMNKMVDLYVAMVMRGLKTIDEVPLRYREEVKEILAKLEK